MRMRAGNGGWASFEDEDHRGVVRFTLRDGRLEASELYLHDLEGDPPKLSRLEALANSPELRPKLEKHLEVPGPDLRRLASFYATTFTSNEDHWVARSFRAQIKDSGEEQPRMRRDRRARKLERLSRLEIPDQARYPDKFYKRVAYVYGVLIREGERPAAVLAEANDVPITTVHRWAKEARRRGFFPPDYPRAERI